MPARRREVQRGSGGSTQAPPASANACRKSPPQTGWGAKPGRGGRAAPTGRQDGRAKTHIERPNTSARRRKEPTEGGARIERALPTEGTEPTKDQPNQQDAAQPSANACRARAYIERPNTSARRRKEPTEGGARVERALPTEGTEPTNDQPNQQDAAQPSANARRKTGGKGVNGGRGFRGAPHSAGLTLRNARNIAPCWQAPTQPRQH